MSRLATRRFLAAFTVLLVGSAVTVAERQGRVPGLLPPVPIPSDNPQTDAKVKLGAQLFFDPRLSADDTISCDTCHDPAMAWANHRATDMGIKGREGNRNSGTILDAAYMKYQFWDGRATSLEEQALGPIHNPVEMGETLDNVVRKLSAIAGYRDQFRAVFGTDVTTDGIAKAIAAFERTVVAGPSPYDRHLQGDASALSAEAKRGLEIFEGKGREVYDHGGVANPNLDPRMQPLKLTEGERKALRAFLESLTGTMPDILDAQAARTVESLAEVPMSKARFPRQLRTWIAGAVLAAAAAVATGAQEAEDRTLLSRDQMVAIINEASGERAMHHVLELVPYPRIRPQGEYEGNFRESTVMANFAKEYGYSNVGIESFPSGGQLWQPNRGELWLVAPENRKLYDIHEVAVSIASGSASGDVTAELVDVGLGRPQDFEGKDVTGKIAIGAGGVGQVYTQAIQRGAVGAIGYSSLRADDYPDQIPSSSINTPAGATAGFGWAVSPRVGRELVGMLARGQAVRLRSIVNAGTFPGELEMVHAMIPGDGSTDQEVIVSAHLYEGYLKQGGNDDNSGCAMTLEIGRAYIKLVKEGKLPPPKRTIHFLWVPELSGTRAWLDAHPDVQKKLIADLNFDMEGVRLTTSRSYWVLHRTPDTFPSFLNDIAQSMMEYVAEVARERVRYRANGYAPVNPVVAPNGSRDPFYIKIDQHYGSSDHVAYMDRGIPSVMFITWPDMWYHSSQDTPDKQDSTQYKRGAVVGIGAMTVLAAGGDVMASRVVAENLARGTSRMGASQVKGLGYMADVTSAQGLTAAYREAVVAVKHQAEVEKKVVQSAAVLFDNPAAASKELASFVPVIDQRAAALLEEARLMYRMQAAERGAQPAEPAMTPLEREAASLVVEQVAGAGRGGGRGAGGGGGGRGGGAAAAPGAMIPQHMNAELSILLRQNKTVLEIRDFLSGEFEPLPLETLMAVLKAREAQGSIRLVARR